jgi:hypothetical protein
MQGRRVGLFGSLCSTSSLFCKVPVVTKALAAGLLQNTGEPIPVLGRVVIAKNPAFHPGDVRVFEAVRAPHLTHLVDVVVFPVKGDRPHPNELSGSGLYFINKEAGQFSVLLAYDDCC